MLIILVKIFLKKLNSVYRRQDIEFTEMFSKSEHESDIHKSLHFLKLDHIFYILNH